MADRTYPILRLVLNETPVEFLDTDILECYLVQESNIISAELPISTVSLRIFTEDPRFSIFSDGIFYQSLAKNAPVDLYLAEQDLGSAPSEKFIGKFYLDSWEMESENILKFELVDILGVCANTDYPGSFWESYTSFQDIMLEIIKNTPAVWLISGDIIYKELKGWIPPGSVRDALQQLCFAAGASLSTDRHIIPSGWLKFSDITLPEIADYSSYPTITDAEKTSDQTVQHLPQITDIVLISHDYYNLGAAAQTVEEIYSAWLEPGNYIISYPKPYWKVWGEGVGSVPIYIAAEDDRVIVTEDSATVWGATARVASESETFVFFSNYASITVDVAGQITLWGYPWLSADRPHRFSDPADSANALNIVDAMLVDSTNAPDILARIAEYYQLRYRTNIKVYPKDIMLKDIYVIDSFRDKQLIAAIERLETDLSGGSIIDVTATGIEYIPPV